MENDKILKRFSQVKTPFRVLLLPGDLMSHSDYKAYIILRITKWSTIVAAGLFIHGITTRYIYTK
jgi:hypothetical protein